MSTRRRAAPTTSVFGTRGLEDVYVRVLARFADAIGRAAGAPLVAIGTRECLGCSTPMTEPNLYCGVLCEEEAGFVRYTRGAIADGRAATPAVAQAIATRLLMLSAGGYDKKARAIPAATRALVAERDGGRCRTCGASGTEIDHINGPSPDPSNLRLLCSACNAAAMRARVRVVSTEDDPETAMRLCAQHERLAARVVADPPARPCDDQRTWASSWQRLKRERRAAL